MNADVTRIPVGGDAPYDVLVGTGILGALPSLVPARAQTVAIIHDERLGTLAKRAELALDAAGFSVVATAVPQGEAAKSIDVAGRLWSWLAQSTVTRTDCVVGLGGGAATDLAGFAAATWLRGVPVVQVPTTLLGMVDAAVGGKTAIDIPEGKNLVGAFHPPAGVLCDLDALATLEPADYIAGLAETIKAGFIADAEILRLVEGDPGDAAHSRGRHARELVERAIRVKAQVVSADLKEAGPREMLNYGHTLGHAIERVERYQVRHGYAVAIGMVFAAEVGWLAGRLDEASVARHRAILQSVGLPAHYHPRDRWPQLREAMSVDKKARGAQLRMVVLDGEGHPGILAAPPEELLEEAFASVSDKAPA
ncbi:MAG TPA: 3-dehydroquinate synthase [Trebonia sp.]|jgi:3-dehydroquinate synthase|nr:3-dehydroquinate synthase [Trebonia sp.]